MQNENKKIYKKIKINNLYISFIKSKRKKNGPSLTVVFLAGYKSDMKGKKARFIDLLRKEIGFEYLRFDYSGHGKSEGNIENQTISLWLEQAMYLIKKETNYPVILVGSSMGGWLSLLLSLRLKKKISGIIGIAAAPDFTKTVLKSLTKEQKDFYKKKEYIAIDSEYANSQYIFTKNFLEDAKKNYILINKNNIPSRLYLLYGTEDSSVSLDIQLQILKKINAKETKLFISKGSDHRLSSKEDLNLLKVMLDNMIKCCV